MKRFFKPKGKDDKPTPYPLELVSPPSQPYNSGAPIYAAYSSQPAPGPPPGSGGAGADVFPPPGSAGFGDARDGSGSSPASSGTDLGQRAPNTHRHGMLHRKERGSRDFEGAVGGPDSSEQARVTRRTSLKGDGKLFGWGTGGKDKDRHRKDDEEQGNDMWWAPTRRKR